MKILVVSGFLGAGKTTFIKTLAKKTGKLFAILENEYADQNIDGDILKSDKNLNIWELTEGCVCCSAKDDLAASVLTIANSIDPDYLVIEPTGVAFLSNMINNLKKIEYERISIVAPIAIVDALAFDASINRYGKICSDQINSASTVIFSKTENFSADEKKSLEEKISSFVDTTDSRRIITEHYSKFPPSFFDELLNYSYDGKKFVSENKAVTISDDKMPDTFSLADAKFCSMEEFSVFIEDVIHGAFGNIVRSKGVIKVGQEKIRYDVVDGMYAITGAEENTDNKIIFIGNEIKKAKILHRFSMQKISDRASAFVKKIDKSHATKLGKIFGKLPRKD